MANTFKLTSQVATNSMLMLLLNNLVWGKNVNTKYSQYFGNRVDALGDTVSIRRAQEFIATSGPDVTNTLQDIQTGSTTVTIDTQRNVAFQWTARERELSVDQLLNDSILNGKMAALAQQIETDIADEAKEFAHWVGTPGQVVNSAADYLKSPERLDEEAIPINGRVGILPPADFYGIGSSFTTQTFYGNDINDNALKKMALPMVGSVQPYMAQTSVAIETGTRTPADSLGFQVNGASQNVNYEDVRDGYTQTINLDNFGAGNTVSRGETFTIVGVNAVNPRTKVDQGRLQEFTVLADATADSTGAITLTIANPIIIASGAGTTLRTNQAFQTCTAAPADGAVVTFKGDASTTYRVPCTYHKDAIHLAFVQPARPHTGEYNYATDPTTGITIRVWAVSDGLTDVHTYRCDVVYGVDNIDRRLGHKLSGTA